MAGNAWSAVTRNLSERIVLRSDRDKCSPLNGRIARLLGSTQKISGSSLPSAMGKITIAQARSRILRSMAITQELQERSEAHTSELQSPMRIPYAVSSLKQ